MDIGQLVQPASAIGFHGGRFRVVVSEGFLSEGVGQARRAWERLAGGASPRNRTPPALSPGGAKDKTLHPSGLRPFGAARCWGVCPGPHGPG
jgi:hypothetical protein